MIISAIGNITVLSLLIKRRLKSHSRIDMMLTHLAIADLLVSIDPQKIKYKFKGASKGKPIKHMAFHPSIQRHEISNVIHDITHQSNANPFNVTLFVHTPFS